MQDLGSRIDERIPGRDRARGRFLGRVLPDLPGLGVAGETREEVEQLIREAIPFHLEGLRESGDPIPLPSAVAATSVDISIA
jgi:predicted RNase H-like HicB family nuclease